MRLIAISTLALARAGCSSPRPPVGAMQAAGQGPASMRGRLFISPMGEPYRAEAQGTDLVSHWFARVDKDETGR